MNVEKVIIDLYDDYVRTVDDPAGVKVGEAKIAIRSDVRDLVKASNRDVDRETDDVLDRAIAAERSKRSRSIKTQIDYLVDGLSEDGAYIDPLLNMAFGLGDTHGVDKTLRNWTDEDVRNLVVTRYRVSAEATSAAADFDKSAQHLLEKMRIVGAATIGAVPWGDK